MYPSTVYILMCTKYACLSLNIILCIQCSTEWLCSHSIMCLSNVSTDYNTMTLFCNIVKYILYLICMYCTVCISACTMMYTFMYTVHPTVTCTVTVYCIMNAGALDRVHYIQIKDGATGHSYHSLFKDVLDGNVTEVTVLDPYIRAKHQVGTQLL